MKNRITWIFDPENNRIGTEGARNAGTSHFVACPWVLFGALGQSDREAMQQIYAAAYALTQAQFNGTETEQAAEEEEYSEAELARFRRLLADVEDVELYGEG